MFKSLLFSALLIAIVSCFTLTVTGCKSNETVAAHLAISYGTAKYIEKAGPAGYVERALKVRDVVDKVESTVEFDDTTIDALRLYVAQRLDHLPPSDRLLAGQLIDIATEELRARVGTGVIPPDAKIKVKEVLSWVREATFAYAPANGSE